LPLPLYCSCCCCCCWCCQGKKVLELGCGHGLPGILCQLAGATVHYQVRTLLWPLIINCVRDAAMEEQGSLSSCSSSSSPPPPDCLLLVWCISAHLFSFCCVHVDDGGSVCVVACRTSTSR
jgi:hypothetical protein